MHSAGYFHGDVKPENLLVADDFSVKLTDFGFTDRIANTRKQHRGTEGFTAPELTDLLPYCGI